MAAGGGLITSGAHYSYRQGPDGRSFAVAGEVGISTAKGQTPQDTLARARQIQAAALAPSDPSGQDYAVAAAAAQMALQAQSELASSSRAEALSDSSSNAPHRHGSAARTYRDIAQTSLRPQSPNLNLQA